MQRRAFLLSPAAAALAAPTAAPDWPRAEPAAAGFDAARLEAARAALERRGTKSLLILKGGRLALEWYASGMNAGSKHYTASMAKALVGGVSLLVAMNDRRIAAGDRASKFIPDWRDDPRKSKITIRDLATHTSGIEDSSIAGTAHTEEPGWKGRFWKREPDPFTISVREAPLLFDPGKGNQYSNPGMAALAWAVTASLRGAPQSDILALLRDRVMRPLGIPDDAWSIGYGRAYRVDGLDLYANWGGGGYTARATARVAEWLMKKGAWEGKPLVNPAAVERALRYAGAPLPKRVGESRAPGSGLAFYTNFDGAWPSVPRDAFAGAGAGHQVFLAVPSLDLVVVRNGGDLAPRTETAFWDAIYNYLFHPLMAALGEPAKPEPVPYPQSKVFRGIEFEPVTSIARAAEDCDNWPMTWGDDDAIYTSYGDGWGFDPRVERKLSQGFARIDGGPSDFRGVNIRSASGELPGDGPKGGKASGMVMVDGVVYMWVRNLGNAQLWWSRDRLRTWEKGFKFDRGFGSPAFLNYGRNNAGARDEYVYTYSQEGPSAYQNDDGVVLARAPRNRLTERAAWSFHTGNGWSPDIGAARPVFRFPRHIQRVDAVYHAAAKRFLLAVGYGHNGGWGIFDAPDPQGPWSTVFHTEYWGLGETHGYRIPSKWISPDGRSLAVVFSGLIFNGVSYDAFCVRGMKLVF